MACTQPYWSSLQVGSQHLARQFADHGWKVHYLSSPVTPFHLLKFRSDETKKRLYYSFSEPRRHYGNMITSYIPLSIIAPLTLPVFRSTAVIEKWYKTMLKSLKTLLINNKKDAYHLLYIDNIFYHFLLPLIKYSKSIFRVMDVHTGFSGWNEDSILKIAKKIAVQSDLTIYSAKGLEEYVKHLSPGKAFLIPNGVDTNLFRNAISNNSDKIHPALENIPTPIILYSGMIDSRVDFKLIRKAAIKMPTISFVFAGPIAEAKPPKNLPGNIFFIGPVPHREIPILMSSAKAGIIPFDTKNHMKRIKGIRPLKLFEYFAAGIPAISARWPEIEAIKSPAWVYDDEEGFISFVKRAIHGSYDTEPFISFSENHNWKDKFNSLIDCLAISD